MFLLIVTVLQRPQSVPSWQRFWWARFLLCELWWLINCVYGDWKIVPLNNSPAEAIDCCDSEVDGEITGLAFSYEDYNTAKNLRHFHVLFCQDLVAEFSILFRFLCPDNWAIWVSGISFSLSVCIIVFVLLWFRRRSLFIPPFWAIVLWDRGGLFRTAYSIHR